MLRIVNVVASAGAMTPTFEQTLELVQLASIIEFPEIFCLLGKFFPFHESISLVCDDI